MTEADLIDALCRNVAGRPASGLSWREVARVRDAVDRLLNREIDRLQALDHSGDGRPASSDVKAGDPSAVAP